MKRLSATLTASALLVGLSCGTGFAQDHHDDRDHHEQQYVRHDEWKKGEHIRHEDWDRGERVDYKQYHLRRPPNGYEWREVDGNYVLAAPTGVIASTIVASSVH